MMEFREMAQGYAKVYLNGNSHVAQLPLEVRELLKITKEDTIKFTRDKNGRIYITKVEVKLNEKKNKNKKAG